MPEPIRFHLDPRCPWCWQTSKWVRQIERLGVVAVSWGLFSLEVVNFSKPVAEFDETRSVAAPSQRTLVAVRDSAGQAAASRFYEAIGTRYFDLEQDLTARSTITGGLGSPMARATNSRRVRKSTPNAASQLAWHEIRLPTTGTS